MMDYDVVSEDSVGDLIQSVKEAIAKGYEPTGGVFVLHRSWTNERKGYEESETRYFQAVIKRTDGTTT